MLSVNQMNGQIKLTEALKILYVPIYPTKWEPKKTLEDEKTTRATQANIIPVLQKPQCHRQPMTMMQKNCGIKPH